MNRSALYLKKAFKVLLYTAGSALTVYVVFMLVFGGYGKKPVTFARPKNEQHMAFFAHRGLSGYYPESSMLAMEAARHKGFDGVELDIRKDKDNELIIFHDDDCERLFGFKGRIDTMSLAQIKKYPLIYKEKKSNSYVISVKELLACYKDSLLFYFDMKLSDFKTADDIAKLIKEYGIEKKCIVANSSFPFIFYMEYKYPEIITALEGFDAGKEWTYYLMPEALKPDFFSGFSWNIDQSHIDWLKKNDLLEDRIVYGVGFDKGVDNTKTMMKDGFTNLIVDYDTNMTGISAFENELNRLRVKCP